MNNDKLKTLSYDNYIRPKVTHQDTIQNKDDMLKLLEDYERVEDIEEVPLGTHIRYVTLDKNKKQVFRLGGNLIKIHERYLVLSNKNHKWSVQRYHYSDDLSIDDPVFDTVFWRYLPKNEIMEKKIEEQDEIIEKLKNYIKINIKNSNIKNR